MALKKEKIHETLIYVVLWGLLFIAPALSLYVRTTVDTRQDFDWNEVFMVWRQYAVFFAVFLVHNYLLAPLFVDKQKRLAYFSAIVGLLSVVVLYECAHRPLTEPGRQPLAGRALPPADRALPPDFQHREKPASEPFHGPRAPSADMEGLAGHMPPDDGMMPPDADAMPPGGGTLPPDAEKHSDRKPPVIVGEHDIVMLVILVLMLGMNIGVKLYFKQRHDQRAMKELEKHSLEQQLEYLKYQINPHFLMNTLNNIHALVDIDPVRAKETILELSKLLRFVLYEGNKQGVAVSRELAFLDNYIQLMRLRYTDKVRITFQKPDALPEATIPPLMLITFVENAFKHGVSYRQESFIDISIATSDGRLTFTCSNSKITATEDKHGGVGLQNVRQRLELIYGKKYSLTIDDQPETYNIRLEIPLL